LLHIAGPDARAAQADPREMRSRGRDGSASCGSRCRRRAALQAAIAFAVLVTAAACDDRSSWPTSSISVGVDGLRTYTVISELPDGSLIGCGQVLASDPIIGVFHGDPEATEPVWVEDHDGQQLSFVWPKGFTVRFEPEAVLRSGVGQVVAREGDPVEFPMTERDQAAGTYADPYIPMCSVFGGAYIYLPPGHWTRTPAPIDVPGP
jgi:hypothetical protein